MVWLSSTNKYSQQPSLRLAFSASSTASGAGYPYMMGIILFDLHFGHIHPIASPPIKKASRTRPDANNSSQYKYRMNSWFSMLYLSKMVIKSLN